MQTISGSFKFISSRNGTPELIVKLEEIFRQWKWVEIVDVVCEYDIPRTHLNELDLEIHVEYDIGSTLFWSTKKSSSFTTKKLSTENFQSVFLKYNQSKQSDRYVYTVTYEAHMRKNQNAEEIFTLVNTPAMSECQKQIHQSVQFNLRTKECIWILTRHLFQTFESKTYVEITDVSLVSDDNIRSHTLLKNTGFEISATLKSGTVVLLYGANLCSAPVLWKDVVSFSITADLNATDVTASPDFYVNSFSYTARRGVQKQERILNRVRDISDANSRSQMIGIVLYLGESRIVRRSLTFSAKNDLSVVAQFLTEIARAPVVCGLRIDSLSPAYFEAVEIVDDMRVNIKSDTSEFLPAVYPSFGVFFKLCGKDYISMDGYAVDGIAYTLQYSVHYTGTFELSC